jgi:hypothetical protein
MERPMNTPRLPRTDSIQELAKFWDTHDLSDFEDELEEAVEPVFQRETEITVRLETKEAEVVRKLAESRGVADSDLIRQWVIERIHARDRAGIAVRSIHVEPSDTIEMFVLDY